MGRSLRTWTHADVRVVDDGEVSFSIVPRLDCVSNSLGYSRWGHEREPKENNAGGRGEVSVEGKRAEIRVEGESHADRLLGLFRKHLVICAGECRLCSGDIVFVLAKAFHNVLGDILVDKKPHQVSRVFSTG